MTSAPPPSKPEAPITLTGAQGKPIAVVIEPKTTPPFAVQYAPYGTAIAAVVAATIAAGVALWGIRANRKNLLAQLDTQRDLAAEQFSLQRDIATRQLQTQQELSLSQQETQRQLSAKTSRASVVSSSRQRWIDGLREDLAELISADQVLLEDINANIKSMSPEDFRLHSSRVNAANDRRRMLHRRIQLRLNPEKENHVELLNSIFELLNATDSKNHELALSDLIARSQSLLRQEWLRVKAEASGEEAIIPKINNTNTDEQRNRN